MRIKSKRIVTFNDPVPVYDITVPVTENFALASGIFVHNSKDIADAVVGACKAASMDRLVRRQMAVTTELKEGDEAKTVSRRNITRRKSVRG